MTEREAYLAFNLLPGIGPVRVQRLLDVFGAPEAVLTAGRDRLQAVQGIGRELAGKIANWESTIDLAREKRRIREEGLKLVIPSDDHYPANLKNTHDPPLALYVKGGLIPADRHAVAIVGSRRTTNYGIECARRFGFQLAHAGLTVVSGLARGIDTAAHEGALAAHGRTVAVIGCGLGDIYPPENKVLADRIAENGAVVSEFPIDFPGDKQSFPLRNRIVAGWGFGVLVVEAPSRSGALITANQAIEIGRSVYAVPGPIDRPTSQGSNRLIQDGAKLVTCVEDILSETGELFPSTPEPGELHKTRPNVELSEDELKIYDLLGSDEMQIDQIISQTGLSAPLVSTTLMKLEMKKLVKQLSGKNFVKLI